MRITEEQLREMVRSKVQEKLENLKQEGKINLQEASDFTARRKVIQSAQDASMNFENDIINTLGLEHPDNLDDNLQQKYYEIAKSMQDKVVSAAMEAAKYLSSFPRKDSGKGRK